MELLPTCVITQNFVALGQTVWGPKNVRVLGGEVADPREPHFSFSCVTMPNSVTQDLPQQYPALRALHADAR